ncbi:MAG: AmmeMemoRadiSam system protein B [Nitrococcus mobilis]|nr:AmmeMemoRadiSam system protein B [Nitrococcus mobilis]
MARKVREPAVAELFYPGAAEPLRRLLGELMSRRVAEPHTPKALIVPHAGYVFSGSTAAAAYARIAPAHARIERVVLLGPAHRVRFAGIAAHTGDAFSTPLGEVALDSSALGRLADLAYVGFSDEAHAEEHSLEVQVPFLQYLLDDFRLVPLAVGDATAEAVAAVLERLWGGAETLIVVSTDLSHYHDYETARRMDSRTAENILGKRPEAIGYQDACGRNPLVGLLELARRRGLRIEQLRLCSSGDTAGNRQRVVGYGAFAVYED